MHPLLAALLLLPAYGEPDQGGRPGPNERLLTVLTNQVRQAPHAWPGWDTSLATGEARPPVAHNPGLLEAARFHAVDMAENGCFELDHSSCDGTSAMTRISRYYGGPSGENQYLAIGDRSARRAITSWMTSDGHRSNMLHGAWNELGAGFAESGGRVLYVQDFGEAQGLEMPSIPAGAFEQSNGALLLVANYFDPRGASPRSFDAILDGAPLAMESVAGPPGNETFEVPADLVDECAPLHFVTVTGDGDRVTYPTEGSLLVGADCTQTYAKKRTSGPGGPNGPEIIDADDPRGGCRAIGPGEGGLFELVLVGFLGLLRRRR